MQSYFTSLSRFWVPMLAIGLATAGCTGAKAARPASGAPRPAAAPPADASAVAVVPPPSSAPDRIYLFDVRVTRGDGQVLRTGSAVLRAAGGSGELVVALGGAPDQYKVHASARDPERPELDLMVAGLKIRTRVHLEEGVRVVIAEAARPDHTEGILVMATAFATDEAMRRALAERVAAIR